jgi:hypothetical protein
MTTIFATETRTPDFSRYKTQWESALLAHTVAATVSLEDPDQKDLLRVWLVGLFNGAGFAAEAEKDGLGGGSLDWRAAGPTQFDLIYRSTYGLVCPLGRAYMQPNGTWAAMVVAGVKDELPEAMASAEWAIARLSS